MEAEVQDHQQSVDMEEGQDGDRRVLLAGAVERAEEFDHRHQVAVREHDSLGLPGRAARVGQRDHLLRVEFEIRRPAARPRQCFEGAVAESEDLSKAAAAGLCHPFGELRRRESHHRARVGELGRDLVGREARVDRRHRRAGLDGGVEGDRVLQAVGCADGGHLTRL